MGDVIASAKMVLEATTADIPYVDISAYTFGLRTMRHNDRPQTGPRGQGGARVGTRKSGGREGDVPVAFEMNEVTNGIAAANHGKTVGFRESREGKTPGTANRSWSGPFMRTSIRAEPGGVVVVTGTSCISNGYTDGTN